MNYFPFHLGDYAAHTAHLEPMEDLAYRRLLDQYYLRECALPADIQELARLIRLRSNSEDIALVLREFFVLADDGWIHLRCDEEIAKMRAKLDASEEKDQHEKDRMQRFRERRAAMFTALREHNIVPAYDIAMKDLQRLFDETCNTPVTPATHLQREQTVSNETPATAIPTPTPTPTPIYKEKGEARSRPPPKPDGVDGQIWSDWLALRKTKRAPVTLTVLEKARTEAQKASMTLEAFLAVWCSRGSQGLEASWLRQDGRTLGNQTANNPQSYRERDAQIAADRVASVAPNIAAKSRLPYVDAADYIEAMGKTKPLELSHAA
jgi:uncharacterized protein YdaU (DUF1376 family)